MLNTLIFQQQQMLLEQKILQTQAQIEAQATLLRNSGIAVPSFPAAQSPPAKFQATRPMQNNAVVAPPAPKRFRQPLGEIENTMWDDSEEAGDIKTLMTRERLARNKISRLALTEAARLEMQLQNLNIKKNSNRGAETDFDSTTSPLYTTPRKDQTPQVVERETTSDGQVIYDFKPGTPGGMCVYFLKGFCSLGNKCRYVHDETDDGRFVKVTGMPYDVTAEKIVEFFSPLKVQPENIMFITANGKPTGSAIIEFLDRKEALMSQSKDRAHITEQRYVLLYPSSRKEKMWHMAKAVGTTTTPVAVRRGSPGSGTSMGLTPSPMLSFGRVNVPAAIPSVATPQKDDATTRNLLSTLMEADEESPSKAFDKPLPPIGSGLEPPALVNKMNADDWLTHLQLALNKSSNQSVSIPLLVTAPGPAVESALAKLGYGSTACAEIIKALQEISAKTRLPFENQEVPSDMPSLLPLCE